MSDILYEDPYLEIAKKYPDAYVASWSAAELWDMIDELPRDIILFSKNLETTNNICDLNVRIKKVPEHFFFDMELQKADEGGFYISSPTKTMADCFAFPEWAGGERQVDYIFSIYSESSLYNPTLLLKYAKKLLPAQKVSHVLKLIQEVKNDRCSNTY